MRSVGRMIRPHNVFILKILAAAIVFLSIVYVLALKYIDAFATGPTNAIEVAELNAPVKLYDNGTIYTAGAVVNENGSLYKMVDPIGAAGYSPTRPGDRSWSKIKKYDNTFVYSPGDVIEHKGRIYKMVEGVGAAGYAPDRPGDKSWKQEKTDSKKANAFTHAARWYG